MLGNQILYNTIYNKIGPRTVYLFNSTYYQTLTIDHQKLTICTKQIPTDSRKSLKGPIYGKHNANYYDLYELNFASTAHEDGIVHKR